MRKCTLSCALAVLVLNAPNAKAGNFDSVYFGINVGSNRSTKSRPPSLPDKTTRYNGVVAGYNWDFQSFLLGVNGFLDSHDSSYTGKDSGVDVKLGVPEEDWLPYVKAGFANSQPGARLHLGLGAEYKFAASWSFYGEWMTDCKNSGTTKYENTNFLIGVNFYFGY